MFTILSFFSNFIYIINVKEEKIFAEIIYLIIILISILLLICFAFNSHFNFLKEKKLVSTPLNGKIFPLIFLFIIICREKKTGEAFF